MTKRYVAAQARFLETEGAELSSRFVEVELPGREDTQVVRTHVLTGGEGPPLLLLHGGGGLAAGWASLAAQLLPGFRIIAPDRPGGGLSDGFDYRGVDLARHASAFVRAVLDALEVERAVFVANSMGARWSTWFGLEHPSRVRGLVALGVPALLLDTSAPLPMRMLGVPGVGRLMMALEPPGERAARMLWGRMGHDQLEPSKALIELSTALTSQPAYAQTWRTLIGRVLSVGGVRPGLALDEDQLARLTMPIAFVFGDNDPFGSPEHGRRAAAVCPDATFELVGRGHLPWLDDPGSCARVVRAVAARAVGDIPRAGATR